MNIRNKIDKFIKPSGTSTFFYTIFKNTYKKHLNSLIQELDQMLNRFENTNSYDDCLNHFINLLISTNEIDKCLCYLYQSSLYYHKIKDYSKELCSFHRILEVCISHENIANRITIMSKCHHDIAIIYEERFEPDLAIEHLLISKSIIKKNGLKDQPIELIDYHIAGIYISRSMFAIAAEYLYGSIFFKTKFSVLFKQNQNILLYILTLVAKNDPISLIRNQLKLIINQCYSFYETDEYGLIINIISSIENKDETHFMYETHRFLKRFKDPVFRDVIFWIKKTRFQDL